MDDTTEDETFKIVKILREEEEKGLLNGNIEDLKQENKKVDDIFKDENAKQIDLFDKKESEKKEEKENDDTFIDSSVDLKKEVIILKNKCKKLEDKLKESHERYNSLAEYFEIISDATIALGKKDLFSDVSDIIFQVSPKGRITYINSAVEKIADYTSSSLIGEKFSKIIPKNDWKKIHNQFFSGFKKKNIMDRELNSFESCIITSTDKKVPVEINGKLIRYNVEVMGRKNEVRIQGSIRDITERLAAEEERIRNARKIEEMNIKLQATNKDLKTAQKELKILNQDLEEKVEERTKEIQQLLKNKIEFIGQLGHDLKSPLTPLIGLLPTLQEKTKDPELKELVEVINRNVYYIRDIVVKTLKLERLSSTNLELYLKPFNLYDLIENFISNSSYITKERNLKIKNNINKNLFVKVDQVEFSELIENLFINAVKFTPDGGSIVFNAIKDKDGFIKININDTGKGLTQDQIDKVFEDFYKVDPSRHELDSSGLGLSICKKIVEKHGGDIWAESPGVDQGCTFNFLMPEYRK